MRFVQLLLTDDQAAKVANALATEHESFSIEIPEEATPEEVELIHERADEERRQIGRLQVLFAEASVSPSKFPPTGKAASTVRSIVRRAKGQSKPASLSKKRSGRAQRRRAERHLFRRNREYIEQYNKGVEIMQAEQAEHERNLAEIEKRIEGQPTFTIMDGFDRVIMEGIPAEFIRAEDGSTPLHKSIIVAS